MTIPLTSTIAEALAKKKADYHAEKALNGAKTWVCLYLDCRHRQKAWGRPEKCPKCGRVSHEKNMTGGK